MQQAIESPAPRQDEPLAPDGKLNLDPPEVPKQIVLPASQEERDDFLRKQVNEDYERERLSKSPAEICSPDGKLNMTDQEAIEICSTLLGVPYSPPEPADDSPQVDAEPKSYGELLQVVERAGVDDDDDGDGDPGMEFISHAERDRRRRVQRLGWIASLIVALLAGVILRSLIA